MTRYLSAERMTKDDFGVQFTNEIGEVIYDAMTVYGSWATMTQESWDGHSVGHLGVGLGQKYERNSEGHLILVEGGSK